ncbi:hypothetical protein [Luteibacter sp.]|jgi:hypothetical protein|uniref:hypothetical protein n=1 Tax=Luteibacter sp. TaxID=1886636 RepID=UPI002F3F254D
MRVQLKRILRRTGFVAALFLITWLFVGCEKVYGDHEVGNWHWPFIKHEPSFQVHFENPADVGLEILPPDKLTRGEQWKLPKFCEVRYGVSSVISCYEAMCEERMPRTEEGLKKSLEWDGICFHRDRAFWRQSYE